MFTASTRRDFGVAGFSAQLAADRDFMLHAVERHGMHHDTRLFPAMQGSARRVGVLWLILEGSLELGDPPDDVALAAPLSLALSERDYHGADGRRSFHYRTGGERFRALELRFRTQGTASFEPQHRPLGAKGLAAVDALWAAMWGHAPAPVVLGRLNALVSHLPEELEVPRFELAPRDRRVVVWDAFQKVYALLDTSSSLKQLAGLLVGNTSFKRIEREVSAVLREHLFPAESWRDITHYTRLALAAFLLSSPEVPIARVAKEVGYGHVTALTNAFAHAGLPAPASLRASLTGARRASTRRSARSA